MQTGSTLIVVASDALARFILRATPGGPLVELAELRVDVHDERPRIQDHFGGGRHRIEAAEEEYLNRVLRRAIDVFRAERSARLVLSAPARALTTLRNNLPQDLAGHLQLAIAGDISGEALAAIERRLADQHV